MDKPTYSASSPVLVNETCFSTEDISSLLQLSPAIMGVGRVEVSYWRRNYNTLPREFRFCDSPLLVKVTHPLYQKDVVEGTLKLKFMRPGEWHGLEATRLAASLLSRRSPPDVAAQVLFRLAAYEEKFKQVNPAKFCPAASSFKKMHPNPLFSWTYNSLLHRARRENLFVRFE